MTSYSKKHEAPGFLFCIEYNAGQTLSYQNVQFNYNLYEAILLLLLLFNVYLCYIEYSFSFSTRNVFFIIQKTILLFSLLIKNAKIKCK